MYDESRELEMLVCPECGLCGTARNGTWTYKLIAKPIPGVFVNGHAQVYTEREYWCDQTVAHRGKGMSVRVRPLTPAEQAAYRLDGEQAVRQMICNPVR